MLSFGTSCAGARGRGRLCFDHEYNANRTASPARTAMHGADEWSLASTLAVLESSLLEDPLKPRAAYPPEYHLAVERLYALCGEGAAAESQSPLRPRRRRHESCTTAHFKAGRTETIRSATAESADFVASVVEGMDLAVQASRLRASAKRHAAVSREAAEGKGIDRHLFALKAIAPKGTALFDDPTYATLAGNELSTTTLTVDSVRQSSFGPVHPEGFGVAYHMPPDELRFCTTTYAPRSATRFGAELEKALRHVERLLSSSSSSK